MASISRCNTPLPNSGLNQTHSVHATDVTSVCITQWHLISTTRVPDFSLACTLLNPFLKTGLVRRALVVSGEYITHLAQTTQKEIETYMDSRLACLTVGDAGAALILEMGPDKKAGFHDFDMYTLGAYSEACIGKGMQV